MNIFADASAIVALFSENDPNHKQAVKLATKFKHHDFLISNYVFAETVAILSQRIDKDKAIIAGEHLKKTYTWVELDKKVESLAWEIFKKQRSKNVSFVDCSVFALYQNGVFDKAFSFDKDFKTNHIPLV